MSRKSVFLATSALALMLPLTAMAQTADAKAPVESKAAPAPTAPAATDPKSPVTHEEFSALLKEALSKDPEIIVDAIKGLQQKQKNQSAKEVEKSIEKYHDDLFNDPTAPSIGDPKTADVTIVEFFDYHCGYCKRMLSTITRLNKEDSKVRIIFREFPILSEDSNTASMAAIAVNHLYPGKYFAFHTALMAASGKFDDKALSDIAKKEGLDWKKIRKEMDSPETKSIIEKNRSMAEDLGVRGTPALVLGKQMLPGAVAYEDLKTMIDNYRGGKAAADTKTEASHPAPSKPAPSKPAN